MTSNEPLHGCIAVPGAHLLEMVEWVIVHLAMPWRSLNEEGKGSVSERSVLEVEATSPSIHIAITNVSWDGMESLQHNLSISWILVINLQRHIPVCEVPENIVFFLTFENIGWGFWKRKLII